MSERNVVLSNVPEDKVVDVLRTEAATSTISKDISQAVIQYTKKTYGWFVAEYAIVDDDIVVHFYPKGDPDTAANKTKFLAWWEEGGFPETLDSVARSYFDATSPRLIAKYAEELRSWWLKAQGFAVRIDPDRFVQKFFEKLDAELGS